MATNNPAKPRVFVDADVLFAGSASPSEHGASLTLLRLAEITLIEALASEQVIVEAERNLTAKLPAALPAFRLLVARCLTIVSIPTTDELAQFEGLADRQDRPILAAAVLNRCSWLVTFNVRHYQPGHPLVSVLPPGEFIRKVRFLLSSLSSAE
jgi:predicted nucleic acid-binding protein